MAGVSKARAWVRLAFVPVVVATLALAWLAAFAQSAHAKDYWVRNNQGHKVGWIRETGPGIDDWSYVLDASGHEVGSAAGHYALMLSQIQFFRTGGSGIWLGEGTKLYSMNARVIGYCRKAGRKWIVFKKTSSGAVRRGTVQGSLKAPHPLMGLRLLLW